MKAETGPIGGDLSHEFIILADTGESAVFCDRRPARDCRIPGDGRRLRRRPDPDRRGRGRGLYAATEDVHDAGALRARDARATDRMTARGIEVGQIFFFGDKYSKPMKALVTGPDGQEVARPRWAAMASASRVWWARSSRPATTTPASSGPTPWPRSASAIVNLRPGDAAVDAACERAYEALTAAGQEPLLDDTDERPGGKFATMDLIGLPWQLIIGPRGRGRGRGRAQAPRHRRAPDPAARRPPWR